MAALKGFPAVLVFSIFILVVSKGFKQSLYHPRFKVDLNHCARFAFLSRH